MSGSTVMLSWGDGLSAELSAADLRAACECAACREPAGAVAIRALLDSGQEITVTEAHLVGNYAVTFTFAPDGHGTGIYPFDRLRSLSVPGD